MLLRINCVVCSLQVFSSVLDGILLCVCVTFRFNNSMDEAAGTSALADDGNQRSSTLTSLNAELQPLLNRLSAGGSISEFWNTLKTWSQESIQLAAHDTVPVVYKLLAGDYTEKSNADVEVVEQLLGLFATVCEPKELLLLLIEQAQENWTGCKFVVTMPAVSRCIRRISPPRSQSVALAVDAFAGYLESLPVPDVGNLEGHERMVVDADPRVHCVCVLLPEFLAFARPLIEQVAQNSKEKENWVGLQKEVDVFISSVLKLLERPLGHLDLTGRRLKRSEARIIAEKCVSLLSLLHPDFVRLVSDSRSSKETSLSADSRSGDNSNEKTRPTLATFAFLAFGERVVSKCLPHVYSHQFFLELCCPMLVSLLKEKDLFPALHGVQFCASLLARIEPESLPIDVLESDDLQQLALAIIQRAATARTKELGASMLKLLSAMSRVLDPAARNRYLYILLKISPRVGGVVGHVIGMISDEVVTGLGLPGKNHFSGVELERLLQLVFALPSGEKTDVMENSEHIMAAMKLLRVVLPLDRMSDNRTGIWKLVPLIERNYLRTLHAAIELSKSHYELEIRRTREQRTKYVTGPSGDTDASLTRRQQLGVYEMALHTLDMMESVASQVGSLIETARKDSAIASA